MRGDITTDTIELQRIIRNYWEQVDNLEETDKFLETENLLRQSWRNKKSEHTKNKEGDWMGNQKSPNNEKPRTQMVSLANSTKHLKKI